jgi:hypothetical protein
VAKNIGIKYISTLCRLSYLSYRQKEYDRALYYAKETFNRLIDDASISSELVYGSLELLSGVLMACNEWESAVELIAFAESRRKKYSTSLPLYIRSEVEYNLAELRSRFTEVVFNSIWNDGLALTFEQLKKYILKAQVRDKESFSLQLASDSSKVQPSTVISPAPAASANN